MENAPSQEVTAACGGFLLVAAADARIESVEEARFLAGVVNEAPFKRFETKSLEREYVRLRDFLMKDFDAAEAEILSAIASVKSDERAVEAVMLASRHAVIADDIIKPQEELVIAEIARALGRPAGEI